MHTASLTLTGSVAALAAALQAFDAASADAGNSATPPTPSTNTGAGTVPPMPSLSEVNGVASTPPVPMPTTLPASTTTPVTQDGEDDEDGDETDGSGVDAEGLPWDERIHSSSKKKTAAGVWAARRGGPKGDELSAIKDELRGVTQVPMPLAAPTPASIAPMPIPMPAPAPQPESVAAPVAMPQPIPMPVTAPAAPEPVAAVTTEEWDFAKLMAHIGPKMGSTIDPTYLAAVCQRYGLGSITDSATKPEVIGQLVAQFQADGRW